ncbi:hypothetical protein [Pseudomonas sp. zfem002]|uniref:hypothetical protein n=1 Tax=Pseudomonas sp. zfem002 TaxID=3078197 RepID=UPI0029276C00|nr:hypothetical protein [Pseudomonas sp. zfem002]MDU9393133.1 hypothetical protein [Pseudomonas sp. zfem002]
MMATSPPLVSPKQLLGMLLAHTYADDARLPHTACGLRKAWEYSHPPFRHTSNNKWNGFFRGAWPKFQFYKKLQMADPNIQGILENLLACALEPDFVDPSFWNERVGLIRVRDQRLSPFSNDFMNLVCRPPHWKKLFILISALRTDSTQYALHREWVKKNLAYYICLCTVFSPLWDVRREFFSLVNALRLPRGLLMHEVWGWFEEFEDYEAVVVLMHEMIGCIRSCSFSNVPNDEVLNIVWRMSDDTKILRHWVMSGRSYESLNLTKKKILEWREDIDPGVRIEAW